MLEDILEVNSNIVKIYGCNSFTLLTVIIFWLVIAPKIQRIFFFSITIIIRNINKFIFYTIFSINFISLTFIRIYIYFVRNAQLFLKNFLIRNKLKILKIIQKVCDIKRKFKLSLDNTTFRTKLIFLNTITNFFDLLRKINPFFINIFFSFLLIVFNIFRIFCCFSVEVLYLYNLIKCFKDITDKCLHYFYTFKKFGKKRKSSDIERHLTGSQLSTIVESNEINEKLISSSEGFFLFTTKKHRIIKRNNELGLFDE
jgi:hypothetical protein